MVTRGAEPIHWVPGEPCCDEAWQEAYLRFETPEQEIAKFMDRHRQLGVDRWPRDLRVAELFCGRGNGLRALERLGFTNLEGVDLSPTLLDRYEGIGQTYVGDCRDLRFDDGTKDVIVIQGGLHHLPDLEDDLGAVLASAHRVLADDGRIVIVEPWRTPFLRLAHLACASRVLRRLWNKLDALACMTELEIVTYERWLRQPAAILEKLERFFEPGRKRVSFGKLMFVGGRRVNPRPARTTPRSPARTAAP